MKDFSQALDIIKEINDAIRSNNRAVMINAIRKFASDEYESLDSLWELSAMNKKTLIDSLEYTINYYVSEIAEHSEIPSQIKYIDVKHTVWERYHLNKQITQIELAERLKKNEDIYYVLEEGDEVIEHNKEVLIGSVEQMTLSENDNQSTIEAFDNYGNKVYQNGE